MLILGLNEFLFCVNYVLLYVLTVWECCAVDGVEDFLTVQSHSPRPNRHQLSQKNVTCMA